ncbi:MAG TPA: FRG domain-containing protein [Polyangiaceae bacterium]
MNRVELERSSLGLRSHQECFFRGHANSDFQLLPSLYRRRDRTYDEYIKLERRMFFEFRTRARQLYDSDYSDWDILFHMQHHGVPTRLLDWTSVFGVALYFALLNYEEGAPFSPCIWLLNPYSLNHAAWKLHRLFSPKYLAREEGENRSYEYSELLLGTHPIDWNTPLAIYSHQRSERMFAQNGWFTIHGTDLRAIEEVFDVAPNRGGVLRKIPIPQAAIPAARQFLDAAGIGHRQLFPDLDGLARAVCEKFGISQ